MQREFLSFLEPPASASGYECPRSEEGIVLVDDQYAPAEKVQAALKIISDKPVRFVINAHYHDDHTRANGYFQKQASIIAHDNVRKRLESGGVAGNGSSVRFDAKPQPKKTLPILTFDHDITVHLNGEDIRALYFAAGHADGDSIIFLPKSNVVHMGDDFGTYGFPEPHCGRLRRTAKSDNFRKFLRTSPV